MFNFQIQLSTHVLTMKAMLIHFLIYNGVVEPFKNHSRCFCTPRDRRKGPTNPVEKRDKSHEQFAERNAVKSISHLLSLAKILPFANVLCHKAMGKHLLLVVVLHGTVPTVRNLIRSTKSTIVLPFTQYLEGFVLQVHLLSYKMTYTKDYSLSHCL